MRKPVGRESLGEFMRVLGRDAQSAPRIYFVGGATAVWHGWRDSTIDVDIKIVPDTSDIFELLPALKERLEINIELASPDDFIPPVPGWEERSEFIRQEGKLSFFHYDFYSQALAKLERGHEIDLMDVNVMIERGLIDRQRLLEFFESIEGELYRYPAVDAKAFRKAVEPVVDLKI